MDDDPRWLTDAEQRAWRGLLQMTARLEGRLGRHLQEVSELSHSDFAVLVALTDVPAGRLRISELGRSLAWEKSRLSHHLTRMERRGLVARRECPTDGRGAFVVLTDAGRAAIESAAPAHVGEVRRLVFDVVTPREVEVLGELTERVLAGLDGPAATDGDRGGPVPGGAASRAS